MLKWFYDFYYNFDNYEVIKTRKNGKFYNIVCSISFVSSSFEYENKYGGCIYLWCINLEGKMYIGRSVEDLVKFLENLKNENNIIIYSSDLPLLFLYISEYFNWLDVFCMDINQPLYAKTKDKIEFRDLKALSGMNINDIYIKMFNKELKKQKEYIKTPKSELQLSDIRRVLKESEIIYKYIKNEKNNTKNNKITEIPYTMTGYTRKFVRENTIKYGNNKYRDLIKSLTISDKEEYNLLSKCFSGGFMYAKENYIGKEIKNVHSYDMKSAYIHALLSCKLPMSKSKKIEIRNIEQFEELTKQYLMITTIKITEVSKKKGECPFLKLNKMLLSKNEIIDENDMILYSDCLYLAITSLDYYIIKSIYEFKNISFGTTYAYVKDYLPSEFCHSVIKLYEKKEEQKNKEYNEKTNDIDEINLQNSKKRLASCYGMCVMSLDKKPIKFINGRYIKEEENIDFIELYNKKNDRFLFYPWGVFITAYIRINLFAAIKELGEDFIYCDTDCVKFLNIEKHKQFFDNFNYNIKKINDIAFNKNDINIKYDNIGTFVYEGKYETFKTLGVKKYSYIKNKKFEISVSGLPKRCSKYIYNKYGNNCMRFFNEDLNIPSEESYKYAIIAFNENTTFYVKDYNNKITKINLKCGCYKKNVDFNFSSTDIFIDKIFEISNFL